MGQLLERDPFHHRLDARKNRRLVNTDGMLRRIAVGVEFLQQLRHPFEVIAGALERRVAENADLPQHDVRGWIEIAAVDQEIGRLEGLAARHSRIDADVGEEAAFPPHHRQPAGCPSGRARRIDSWVGYANTPGWPYAAMHTTFPSRT